MGSDNKLITGLHPSGARVTIEVNSQGFYNLECRGLDGGMRHRDWYTTVPEAKKAARINAFDMFEIETGKSNGRWKWSEVNET